MSLRCLEGDEVTVVIKKVHAGVCCEIQGGFRLFKLLIHLGHYWLIVEADAASLARRCQAC